MVISAEPLIYGLIFIAVLALVQGIYLTVFGKSISLNNRVNRRLEMLEKGRRSRTGAGTAPKGNVPAYELAKQFRFMRSWPTRHRRQISPLPRAS